MKNKFSEGRVQSIMESLEGMQHAAAPNFFYTRLKGKMQPAAAKQPFFILRPAFITATLAVLVVVNVVSLFTMNSAPKQVSTAVHQTTTMVAAPATIESFARAYDINSGSVYE